MTGVRVVMLLAGIVLLGLGFGVGCDVTVQPSADQPAGPASTAPSGQL